MSEESLAAVKHVYCVLWKPDGEAVLATSRQSAHRSGCGFHSSESYTIILAPCTAVLTL